ncbi:MULTISPECIES: LpqB family beta-propeller domain-containing protein [unclassified Microbacterium]|uniref:LpqB family beta-propeller domain-containing protein n=1 Tax=unclassified Microbacterium TaxID=2609290 RepID=UPI0023069815|nr:LpqB family beta-propeller domain-containing protein [Microbacterium sp. nov. GSS16]WCD92510.1 LpqB family beta-propeller domain-containing protein [Microbacterium sp. nov. GSS16]
MTSRTGIRLLSALAAALAAAVVLAGCTGLPTSGPPNAGLAVGEEIEEPPFSFIADDPEPGAGPARIVEGFLDASMSPADSWKTARKFLTDDFQSTWKPDAGVTIDKSVEDRDYDSTVESDDEDATSAEVSVSLAQVASVDGTGAYSADTGTANATYRLVREKGGEWRIAEAPDGVTLDVETFSQVYEKFSLKYFDPTWTHLVPDVRWFPRRAAMATTVVRALISGEPSEWLAPAVRPFSSDVEMVGDAVTVDAAQVASVPLNRAALSASPTDLARMRTQLEASLQGAGVAEVRLLVDGVPLDAGRITVDDPIVDPGVLVLGDEMFGTATSGGEIAPVRGLTGQIAKIDDPIAAVDVSADAQLASVQLRDGRVFAVSEGHTNQVDGRSGLITPSLDPFGLIWTVPTSNPTAVQASTAQAEPSAVADAWPSADAINQLRVSADGARVAAIVTSGGERRLVVASIIRDEEQRPISLGTPYYDVAQLSGAVQGLSWVGADAVAVLSATPDPTLTTHMIGGPSAVSSAPAGAVALSGAKTVTGVRVLSTDQSVYALRGSFWQEAIADVRVLGTRAGY